MPRDLILSFLAKAWAIWANAWGIGSIALAVGIVVVQALTGRNAVTTATNVRIEGQGAPFPTMRVRYKGRYRFLYDLERHEACAGEVMTTFESADLVSPAVVTVRPPTVLDEVRA